MQDALRRHDEILRDAIAGHRLELVKSTGDGVHATARRAVDGARAAVAAQRALVAEPWGEVDSIRVRMGLHTGPATARSGDYYGPAVNRAARVMSAAHGGQILASQTAAQLISGVGADDITLVDLGRHRLRDLAQAETLFQLGAPGLADRFPPLRTVDEFPGNLPTQLTSFVGRETELAALRALAGEHRLVTLVGVGGVGKTRLALQHAAATMPSHPGGTWFAELSTVRHPGSVAPLLAATLGADTAGHLDPEQAVTELLRPKRAVLVLDNCEHVLGATARLTRDLLRSCPRLEILATSREALGIDGEQQLPVTPLPLVASDRADARGSAVELFVERSRAVRPDFDLTADNGPAIVEICQRVDGLPLALELAAGRTAALGPAQIARMLDQRFRLLTASRRGADERHQTLQATIDWSYDDLGPLERRVFDRLGVFTGSFDVAAATEVVADDDTTELDVVDALTGLVAKSLVTAELGDDESMRYLLLETLRDYARDKLDANGELDIWSRRHAHVYVDRSRRISAVMMGPDEIEWRPRLRDELGNLRAAVRWALDAPDAADQSLAADIIAPLAHQSVMAPSLGIDDWAAEALERAVAMTPDGRFGVLCAASYREMRAGDYERDRQLAAEAIDLGVIATARFPHMPYVALATQAVLTGRPDESFSMFDEGSRVLTEIGAPPYDHAILTGARGLVEAALGLPTADAVSEAALAFARQAANPSCLVGALFATAVAVRVEDPDRALSLLDEGIALAQAGSNASFLGSALVMAAQLRAARGEHPAARTRLGECADHFDTHPDRPSLVTALALSGSVLTAIGDERTAAVIGGAVLGPYAPLNQMSQADRRTLLDALDAARLALGGTVYDLESARGEAMDLDQLRGLLAAAR